MKNSYSAHHEILKSRKLSAEQIALVADAVSEGLVRDIIPKFRSTDQAVKNKATLAVARISCNALSGAYLLTSVSMDGEGQYAELPETQDVADLLDALKRTSTHIAKIQDPNRIAKNTFMEGEPSAATILKALMCGAQIPTNIDKAALCIDAYIEQAHVANALISILATENPTLTSVPKFDKCYTENVEILDSFAE